jgi:hypothetical protein
MALTFTMTFLFINRPKSVKWKMTEPKVKKENDIVRLGNQLFSDIFLLRAS